MTCLKNLCEGCSVDITMAGSRVCRICDPNIDDILDGVVEAKSPHLCGRCFARHMEEHKDSIISRLLRVLQTMAATVF